MKIFLNNHGKYIDRASKSWMNGFDEALMKHGYQIVYVDISDAEERNRIRDLYRKGDFLVARLNQYRLYCSTWGKGWAYRHKELAVTFGDDMFPSPIEANFYDDKKSQRILFENKKYPYPKTIYAYSEKDVTEQLSGAFDFPLVWKGSSGAGSKRVSMVKSIKEVGFPCLLQEFCPDNDGDIRIYVVGDCVMGYKRLNRDNDWRASGSGKIVYLDELPSECMQIAYKISKENNFNCMSYDFIRNSKKQWVVLECSYTFPNWHVNLGNDWPNDYPLADGCKFAYKIDPQGGFRRVPNDCSIEERVIKTILP